MFNGAVFLLLLGLLTLSTQAASTGLSGSFPRVLLPLCAIPALVHAALGIRRTYHRNRETLSPASVKQALDNLNSGVLFADAAGRVVLLNYAMAHLAEQLCGAYPQLLSELEQGLDNAEARGVSRVGTEASLYRFPDGRVWSFRAVGLTEKELEGFTQVIAQDVTELNEANDRLAGENEALREANVKMRRMLERIADRIREEETLNLKMRIHNEIGSSLIALSEIAAGGAETDTDRQIKILRGAVRCFADNRAAMPEAIEDVRRQAKEMNVTLSMEGYLPENAAVKRLAAVAARECVTNCVRHAGGRHVHMLLSHRGGICTIIFTNDGAAPEGPIREGGGLSSVRFSVERAGGEMHISNSPRFALIINLPEQEEEP